MESTGMVRIRLMTTDDLRFGLKLSRQAGWNQTEADWLRFISLEPEGCFVAELNGQAAGTTATCVLGRVAWIAMVLVDVNSRGKGVGTSLLKHAIAHLQKRKVETIRLDATALGRPIYEKLGFVPEYELARFEGLVPHTPAESSVEKPPLDVFAEIIDFDTQTTDRDRGRMLSRLFQEFPDNLRIIRQSGLIEGFITTRPGANAVQIGPCRATACAGPTLLGDALSRYAGEPVFVDIPLDNTEAVRIAESNRLTIQRCFTRMCCGLKLPDDVETLWASSGPEKG